MPIQNGAGEGRRIRIDIARFADELARRVPDLAAAEAEPVVPDGTDPARQALARVRAMAGTAAHDAAGRARRSLGRGGGRGQSLRSGRARSASTAPTGHPLEEIGRRVGAAATAAGTRAVIARLERELIESRRGPNIRVGTPSRVGGRSGYVVLVAVVGIVAALVVVVLFDPARGKERRAAIGRRVGGPRARRAARHAGPVPGPEARDREATPAVTAASDVTPIAAPAWPAGEGPIEQPLHDPVFGAHEALPEELVSTAAGGDPAGAGPVDAGPHS